MNSNVEQGKLGGRMDLAELEGYLQANLQPVAPRPSFIKELRGRLVKAEGSASSRTNVMEIALVIGAGVVTSVLILVTGIRATISILGALGILHQVNHQVKANQETQAVPLQPAA